MAKENYMAKLKVEIVFKKYYYTVKFDFSGSNKEKY